MAHGRFNNPVVATLTGIKDIFRKQQFSHRLSEKDRADDKVCLITGANSGLGYAMAVDMAKRGAHVIMACRRQIPEAGEQVKAESGSEKVTMMHLDLSRIDSIHRFCDAIVEKNIRIDMTILNAGVATPKASKTDSGLDEIFLVNYLSNFILLNRMLIDGSIPNMTCAGKMKQSETEPGEAAGTGDRANVSQAVPRVIYISSDSHRGSSYIDYEEFGKYFAYGLKKGMNNYSYYKLVLNTLAVEFSRRINKDAMDVSMNVICPGPVNTNIIRSAPWLVRIILRAIFTVTFQSPEKAARAVVYMAISKDYENRSGEYLHMFIEKEMDYKVYLPEEGEKLWKHTVEIWKSVDKKAEVCPI